MFKRKRKSGGDALPWRLPKPMTTDQRIWADYLAFKAAGLLETWFELYRDVLGLEPPLRARRATLILTSFCPMSKNAG